MILLKLLNCCSSAFKKEDDGWKRVDVCPHSCMLRCMSVSFSVVMGLETKELEENQLSDVSSGNKTKLQGEKDFVEISVCRKD